MLACRIRVYCAPYVRPLSVIGDSIPCPSVATGQKALMLSSLCSASSSSLRFHSVENRYLLSALDFDLLKNTVRFQHQKTPIEGMNAPGAQGVDGAGPEKTGAAGHDQPPAEAKLSQGERMKRAVREYGATVIVFHTSISLFTLGVSYAIVSSGIDIVGLMTKIGIGQSVLESKLATGASTFVIAYAVHKVFAPVRMACTLTATPFIVRYLRKIGFLKAPVPKS